MSRLELLVLFLEEPEPPQIGRTQLAVPGHPAEERGLAHAELPARLLDAQPGLGLPQREDELLSVNIDFLMDRAPFRGASSYPSSQMRWSKILGAGHTIRGSQPQVCEILR